MKRILFFCWKDYFNPSRGGAETVNYEVFKRLAQKGYQITWFSPLFTGAKMQETIDGIHFYRTGTPFNIHLKAINFYEKNKDNFDIVIDELHGYPFLVPFYADKPTFTTANEVAGIIWFKMWKWHIATMGFVFERFLYQLLKKHYFISHSESTKKDIHSQGIKLNQIDRLFLGIDAVRVEHIDYPKNENQLCFVGRICKMKGVDIVLKAFGILARTTPDVKLVLVGKMDETFKPELDQIIAEYDLKDKVEILGFVSFEKRDQVMKESKYLVSGSIKEGFGLIIIEGFALGTPAITFDVNSYRELVLNDRTGFLVEKYSAKDMARTMQLGLDTPMYKEIQHNAYEFSKKFDWENTTSQFESFLRKAVNRYPTLPKPNKFKKYFAKGLFTLTAKVGSFLGN